MRSFATISASACLSALPVAAFDLSVCDRDTSFLGYQVMSDHRDHGGGVISHRVEGCVGADCTRRSVLTTCASGQQVTAFSACEQETKGFCESGRRSLDQSDRVHPVLLKMAQSPEPLTLVDVADRLKAHAMGVTLGPISQETCGCRAAYPHLRKGKARFKMERLN